MDEFDEYKCERKKNNRIETFRYVQEEIIAINFNGSIVSSIGNVNFVSKMFSFFASFLLIDDMSPGNPLYFTVEIYNNPMSTSEKHVIIIEYGIVSFISTE